RSVGRDHLVLDGVADGEVRRFAAGVGVCFVDRDFSVDGAHLQARRAFVFGRELHSRAATGGQFTGDGAGQRDRPVAGGHGARAGAGAGRGPVGDGRGGN